MKKRELLLLIICAALSFGGSFNCKGSFNGDDEDDKPKNDQVDTRN